MFGAGIYFAEHSSKVRERLLCCQADFINIIIILRAISTFTVLEEATVVLNIKTDPATLVTGETVIS